MRVEVPALFAIGARDIGLSMPGIDHIIAAMPTLVRRLHPPVTVDGAGQRLQQERPDAFDAVVLSIVALLPDQGCSPCTYDTADTSQRPMQGVSPLFE